MRNALETTRLATVNARLVRTGRDVSANDRATAQQIVPGETIILNNNRDKRATGFQLAHSPAGINNEILSLVDGRGDAQEKNTVQSTYDQQVDQSEMVAVNAGDIKDLENIEHALSIVDYEPQKIKKKKKRKIAGASDDNSDSAASSSENAALSAPDGGDTYYEVSRAGQPKTIIVTPQYYSRTGHEVPKSLDSAPKPRSSSRFPKNRAPLTPQGSSLPEEPRLENAPASRVTHLHRPYPALSGEARKSKHFVDQVATTTPSSEAYSTRASRRRKSRQRVAEKASNQPATNQPEDVINDYAASGVRARNAEGRSKSRRSGLLAKYDVAPRPFARSQAPRGNLENGLEKLRDGGAASNRGSSSRNTHPNALKSSEGESDGVYSTRSPLYGLNRKLYEKKDIRKSPAVQVNVNSSPASFSERPKLAEYQEAGEDRPLPPYKPQQTVQQHTYTEDLSLKAKSVQPVFATNPELASKVPPATPSSLDVYQTIKPPVVTVYSTSSVSSTALPYASPSPYAPNLLFYPPVVSTLAPVERFEGDTVHPWTTQVKSQLKQRDVGAGEGEQKADEIAVDGVAEATNFSSEEGDVSMVDKGKYEIGGTPGEEHRGQGGGSEHASYEHARFEGNGRGGNGHDQQDDETYEQGKSDALGESSDKSTHQSSHEDEPHQGLTEGAGGDGGKGNEGGGGKFEKAEGAVREEGHEDTEGEKGQKGYKSWHEHEKANKGHHDKERKSNYYDEEDGKANEDKEEGGYHEEHQKGEMGEKKAEFDEKGEHQKGYSTKGQHFVHKKDEFEKRTEFFDESHDEDDHEKNGEFYQEHEMSKGGHEKVSHHDEADHEERYGKASKHEKGGHHHDNKGHKISAGHDRHYDHENTHGNKKSHHDGKKWAYKEGDNGDAGKDHKSGH
ncbi:uncharacterized protein LOC143376005 [Andrena cerasifolii]|uniref:uncharacterized protein LOC143376005 n=1 Tax=Andrena cerasifolii TaxID=2819439 RepID=UPI004037B3A1